MRQWLFLHPYCHENTFKVPAASMQTLTNSEDFTGSTSEFPVMCVIVILRILTTTLAATQR